jgi:ABC-2 type transport system permease protein
MFGPTLTISRNTFTEAIRQPIYIILLLGVILVLILGAAWAAYTLDDDNKLLLDTGLSMVLAASGAMAALLASGVLAREIDNKTVLTVISKPIGRPAFVLGKFLGVAGATTLAWLIWSLVFLLTVRHKVLSGAGDQLDGPVWVFGLSALGIAFLVAVWGNYFYNWVFNSTFVRVLTVTLPLAYLLVLLVNKQWQFQPIYTEFDPELAPVTNYGEEAKSLWQVVVALLMLFEAAMILVAGAIAASTRLGNVMTLLVVFGLFVLGIASDGFFGQYRDVNWLADIAYRLTPNVQLFFLADSLTQQHSITWAYAGMASAYASLFIIALLSVGVALFQTREAG